MDARQLFCKIFKKFHACFPFHNILFQAVFLLTGRKRITLYCWHFKNFCQKNKNEKLYFAFDSVIKILKSYRPKKQLELRSHYKKKNDFHPLQIWTYDHMMCILITHYLAKMNEHQNIVILKVDIKT